MRVPGSSFSSSFPECMHPQPPHAIRSPPPASDLQERPSSSSLWTGQSRSQARGRLILGALLSTSFIGPARQPFRRAVNRSTTLPSPSLPTRTRTRTTRGASPSRYVPSFVFVPYCFPASFSHLLARTIPSFCFVLAPAISLCSCMAHHLFPRQYQKSPATLQHLVYQINFSVNPLVRSSKL